MAQLRFFSVNSGCAGAPFHRARALFLRTEEEKNIWKELGMYPGSLALMHLEEKNIKSFNVIEFVA